MKIRRRVLLKATVVAAGGMALGTACGDEEQSGPEGDAGHPDVDTGADTPTPDAGVDVQTDPEPVDVQTDPEPVDGSRFFPQSVMSGDPREDSIVLWTRCVDADADGPMLVLLQVARDEAFTDRLTLDGASSLELGPEAASDHCLKVRLTGLEAGTYYWYRFLYRLPDGDFASRLGRTRTAPAVDADVPVRFATVSCQDFNGKYYNSYKRLLREEVDFIVHLGDYVYETTGDPRYQDTSPDRVMAFSDTDGAIEFDDDGDVFYAARALGNYRDLYKTYRGDQVLQQVQERFPMIVIWDDHEFADDSWGAHSTDTNDREDEFDIERRQNATQAWFEYMPVDYADPDFEYDRTVPVPDDIRIYRDFRFGAHVHLVLTDLRLYRPDHIVPEGAFPGAVAIEEDALTALLGDLPDWAEPYVDVDAHADGAYADALAAAAPLLGFAPEHATGQVAVRYVNRAVAALIESGDDTWAPIEDTAGLPRGLAFLTLGKSSAHSSIGSRYLAIRAPFEAYAAHRWAETDGASEHMLGAEQEAWFLDAMRESTATWRVWGSEFVVQRRVVDVTSFAVPPDFQQQFILSIEDWDGTPNRRDALLNELGALDNVIAVSGDLHAFMAGTPWPGDDSSRKIVEFLGSSISSNTYERMLVRTATADPALAEAGAPALALMVDGLLVAEDPRINPHLAYSNIGENGFAIADVSAEEFAMTFYGTDQRTASDDLPDDEIDAAFAETRFRVPTGTSDLHMEIDGVWNRWDPESGWVEA